MPKEIIEASIKGDLVLFCGAGISTESKDVLPFSFYSCVKDELSIDEDISFCRLMQIYCDKPNGRKRLLNKIRERFNYIKSFPELERLASSFHRELAEIYHIKTIITTNWDTYFEEYCAAIPITIPEDFAFWDDSERFVLKIHGSINNLSTIIATEDDYRKCYGSLQNGALGATLKHILATKTVVFIGFSFGDDDLQQIMEYLQKEMGDIYPYIYIVTLDDGLKERINYKNVTSIVTSGTFFVHNLKNELIKLGEIKNVNIKGIISEVLDATLAIHQKVSSLDLSRFPSAIFTLAYQDGVIHSFERFLNNYSTGEYNIPEQTSLVARKYTDFISESHKKGNYWDEAYYEGYFNGLLLIDEIEDNSEIVYSFPFLYLPGTKKDINGFDIYMEELARLSKGRSKYNNYAKKVLPKDVDKDIVIHHPPI
jgi:hypothetical protein